MPDLENNGLDIGADARRVTPETNGKCPLCEKDTLNEARPFCSVRCANIDLNRWLTESYVMPEPPE